MAPLPFPPPGVDDRCRRLCKWLFDLIYIFLEIFYLKYPEELFFEATLGDNF